MKSLLGAFLVVSLVLASACSKLSPTAPEPPSPVISAFSVSPTSGKSGIAVVLAWDVVGSGARVSIAASAGVNPGDVPVSGNLTVNPLVTTTYTITARSLTTGAQSNRTATFTVTP
jgi:hypothetical protein